jgi:hypothetical protein
MTFFNFDTVNKSKKNIILTESQFYNLISNINTDFLLKENENEKLFSLPTTVQPMDVKNVNQLIIYLKNVVKTLNNPEIKNKIKLTPNEGQYISSFINNLINSAAQPQNLGQKLKTALNKFQSLVKL